MNSRSLPYRHLSVRVPWHDTGWNGVVCADPINNSSCLRLSRIAETRDDHAEVLLAGKNWHELGASQLPPCSAERAGFMSARSRSSIKLHPYAEWNDVYRKFRPTTYEVPAFAADCIPFRWMLRDEAEGIAERYDLDYEGRLEEAVDKEAELDSPAWVQHADNQQLLLDTFFSAVRPERSLVFVYAKESPLSEDRGRILIGVGRVKQVGSVIPYVQDGNGFGSVLWERVIGHSIRPTMEDGFLLPYHEILELADKGECEPEELAVFVPDEFGRQFSYATEHVSHDAALALLLQLDRAVEKFAPLVSGSWDGVRGWLSERIGEVWASRGPCPGLGSALTAFGIKEGVLVAFAAQDQLEENEDAWPLIDTWLRDSSYHPETMARVGTTLSRTWKAIPDERRVLLQLLSRFDLTVEQAIRIYQPTEREKAGIAVTDADIIANPYRIYEADRVAIDPISVGTVDRGVFPDDRVRRARPLPEPSRLAEAVDPRRVRGLVIDVLEESARAGDTLRSRSRVVQEIRDRPCEPECPVSIDVMSVCEESLAPEVALVTMAGGERAYQLHRLEFARKSILREITRRVEKGAPLPVAADWRAVIDELLATQRSDVEDEDRARQEKAAALEALATSRFSVLIGAAGTGKTTLLRALTALPEISDGGVLLLAPTGKARVRLQAAIGENASTIAQLLVRLDRYDVDTGRYHRSDHDRLQAPHTVIVDECSMLTEEVLDALLDGIGGFNRLILVGDPRQLPPIGAGRPFVDIVRYLRDRSGPFAFPKVGPSYAELTIPRRQLGTGGDGDTRADLLLAEWFTGDEPSPGADEVWDRLAGDSQLDSVSARRWDNPGQLHELLRAELARALPEMSGPDDEPGFERSYGGSTGGQYVYFNPGSASRAEDWQVLSPIRAEGGGVTELNRMMQRTYRSAARELARPADPRWQKIPKPAGPQEVVYGDKVINVRNKKRTSYYPKRDDVREYVANGEIGIVTGPFKARGKKVPLNRLEVEFSTQPGVGYKFWPNELGGDDSTPILKLAYAVTIHKSQGSEFGTTFVVLPNPCRLLSRELIYTALTRQRNHVVLLHEGELGDLKQYANAVHSETAARVTNLFAAPVPIEVDGRFLEAGLIHRTRKGITVRSKSELIIADLLYAEGIEFEYERTLRAADGTIRSPDFTIEDDTSGITYYWEHLGMLKVPSYKRRWEKKLEWYRRNDILPHNEGRGVNGTLIITEDGPDGSVSSADIAELVADLLQ